ncbi:hypothetical protein D3C78_1650940 [compost metagenome]
MPPNSSITMAIWVRPFLNSVKRSSTDLFSGTNMASRIKGRMSNSLGSFSSRKAKRSLVWKTPSTLSIESS